MKETMFGIQVGGASLSRCIYHICTMATSAAEVPRGGEAYRSVSLCSRPEGPLHPGIAIPHIAIVWDAVGWRQWAECRRSKHLTAIAAGPRLRWKVLPASSGAACPQTTRVLPCECGTPASPPGLAN